jgi:translation initiation factor IF-1
VLSNSAGELDMISADDLETLARHLGKRLINKVWLLDEGDTIKINRR